MEYEVGKPRFKLALSYAIGWIILNIWLIMAILFVDEDNTRYFIASIFLFILLCAIFISIPGISYCQLMWKVNSQQLKYTYHSTMIDKICSFFVHIFKTHKIDYQISINMDQIDYINVQYVKLPKPPFGAYGFDIMFHVHTYDGSVFSFQSLVTKDRESFNDAVDFMKKQGIYFVDKYNILGELKKDIPISYYLERLEKDND